MEDAIASYSLEQCVMLPCPQGAGTQPCYIPLPRQSPLGRYDGLDYQPTGEWPTIFLCLRHALAYECSPASVHLETDMRLPNQSVSPLWKIDCECDHENCGRRHTIYTGHVSDWLSILLRIMDTNPKIPCGDHLLMWREDSIRATEFAH